MTDAPSEEELVTIEKYVNDLAADALRSQVVALVAALRSERDRVFTVAKERDRAETERADVRAELERERTQNRELLGVIDNCLSALRAHAEQECEECEGVMEEAERFVARAALSAQEAQA